MASFSPAGIYVAMVTPFRADFSIDFDALAQHTDFLINAGVHGLAPIAGSGEYHSLRADERAAVIDTVFSACAGRVPVVVGALGPSTREVIETGLEAARHKAQALLVLPPYYVATSQSGVSNHFEDVIRETGLDVIVYNNPSRTNRPISLELLIELASMPGIVGIKDCERDAGMIVRRVRAVSGRIAYLAGDDDIAFAALLAQGAGAVMTLPNLLPQLGLDLYEASTKGEIGRALDAARRLAALAHIARLPNHPGPLKEAMAMAGRPVGPARRPLMPMSQEEKEAVSRLVDRSLQGTI